MKSNRHITVALNNLVTFAIAILAAEYFDEDIRIVFFAFIFSYILRLQTISIMTKIHAGRMLAGMKARLPALTSRPRPGAKSYPLTEGDQPDGQPAGLYAYYIVMGFVTFVFFVYAYLSDALPSRLPPMAVLQQMGWALLIGVLRWIGDVRAKIIVIDFNKDLPTNLGYNSAELTFLVLFALAGGGAALGVERHFINVGAWIFYGTFVFFRYLADVSQTRRSE